MANEVHVINMNTGISEEGRLLPVSTPNKVSNDERYMFSSPRDIGPAVWQPSFVVSPHPDWATFSGTRWISVGESGHSAFDTNNDYRISVYVPGGVDVKLVGSLRSCNVITASIRLEDGDANRIEDELKLATTPDKSQSGEGVAFSKSFTMPTGNTLYNFTLFFEYTGERIPGPAGLNLEGEIQVAGG